MLRSKTFETETRTGGRVADRAAGQHLTCARRCADASAGVDSHAAPLVAASLALARVDTGANRNTTCRKGLHQIKGATSRLGGSIEESKVIEGIESPGYPLPPMLRSRRC